MGGFYHQERPGASLAPPAKSEGPAGGRALRAERHITRLFAELLDLSFDSRPVLLQRREKLLRRFRVDRTAGSDVDLRGEERGLCLLREVALFGRLVLTNREVAGFERRYSE